MTKLRMRFVAPLIVLIASGCGGATERRTEPVFDAVAPQETVTLLGTEPFWNGVIQGGVLTWTTPENLDGTQAELRRFAGNGGLGWSGELGGERIDIAVGPGPCSDGMSDREYPFNAAVRLGDRSLTGCAYTDASPFSGPATP